MPEREGGDLRGTPGLAAPGLQLCDAWTEKGPLSPAGLWDGETRPQPGFHTAQRELTQQSYPKPLVRELVNPLFCLSLIEVSFCRL